MQINQIPIILSRLCKITLHFLILDIIVHYFNKLFIGKVIAIIML